MAGLTDEGLEIKRYDEIVEDILDSLSTSLGQDLNTDDDSVIRQIVNPLALEVAGLWEVTQGVNDAFTPSKAEGTQLDDNVDIIGIARLDAQSSTVDAAYTGTLGTVIPLGNTVAVNTTQEQFKTTAENTLADSDVQSTEIEVSVVADATLYSVVIDVTVFSITSGGGATANSIAIQLRDAINGGSLDVTASLNGDNLVVTSDTATDTFDYSLTANLGFVTVTNLFTMDSVNTGPIQGPVNQINDIKTPVSGLDSVTNLVEATLGRNRETDTELRIRRGLSLSAGGSCTLDAIIAKVSDVAGTVTVSGVENNTNTTDGDGRPPHSFEIIVQGGTDEDIGQTIWNNKAAGIETFGSTSVVVTDLSGNNPTINFSRPSTVDIWVDVVYTKYDEESFPADGETVIADTVLATGEANGLGEDVLPQRFLGPIFSAVSGIASMVIEVSDDGVSFSGNPIAIAEDQLSDFSLVRITVSEAP